jgi:hypothetical protein
VLDLDIIKNVHFIGTRWLPNEIELLDKALADLDKKQGFKCTEYYKEFIRWCSQIPLRDIPLLINRNSTKLIEYKPLTDYLFVSHREVRLDSNKHKLFKLILHWRLQVGR